jgi:hypothetical protein
MTVADHGVVKAPSSSTGQLVNKLKSVPKTDDEGAALLMVARRQR